MKQPITYLTLLIAELLLIPVIWFSLEILPLPVFFYFQQSIFVLIPFAISLFLFVRHFQNNWHKKSTIIIIGLINIVLILYSVLHWASIIPPYERDNLVYYWKGGAAAEYSDCFPAPLIFYALAIGWLLFFSASICIKLFSQKKDLKY